MANLSDRDGIVDCFTYYPPIKDQHRRYAALTDAFKDLALVIEAACPSSAERTLCIRKLQESRMWANAAIAINEDRGT